MTVASSETIDPLSELGLEVDHTGSASLVLEGRNVLWLVTAGAMDLFAVDSDRLGRWHFLGRLEPGVLLPGPVRGPKHTLVGRPLQGCVLRRIQLSELMRVRRDSWATQRGGAALSPQEEALVRGVDLGLRVMLEATLDGLPPRDFVPLEPGRDVVLGPGQHARSVGGVVWLKVLRGKIQYGSGVGALRDRDEGDILTISERDWISCDGDATVQVLATRDLLLDGSLWPHVINHEARFLFTLDRWIATIDRAHEQQAAAGRRAGALAESRADRALLVAMEHAEPTATQDIQPEDALFTACRLVADATGIALVPPAPDGAGDPLERIALASRCRIREVKLSGRWWRENVGPLVVRLPAGPAALLWHRGGYDLVDPLTGRRERVRDAVADSATMFYRPLPAHPLRAKQLLAFGLRGLGAEMRVILLSGVVSVALGSAVPVATGEILGVFVPNAERSLIVQAALALVLGAVVAASFMLVQNIAMLRMEGRFDATVQAAVWDRLLRLPTRFFAGRSTGELASAAMGVSGIRRIVSGVSSVALQAVVVGSINFVLLLWYSVPLALVALGQLMLGTVLFGCLGLRKLRWQRRLIALKYRLNDHAFQTLRGLPKLRVAAAEGFAYARWAGEFARSRELEQRIGRIWNVETILKAAYLPVCTMMMFALLAGPLKGSLSVSGFLTFSVALSLILTSAVQLTGAITSTASAIPVYDQLRPVLDETPEVRPGSVLPGELSGEIEAHHLSFRYDDDGPAVLDDVSFHVLPGEFVAVVGGSGSGKSTLLRLLIGFDEPTSGTVLYDGQDLAGLDQAAVRRQCGVVLQNAQPFTGSILDCIRGSQTASLDDVWEAAEMSGLARDIRQLPMGLHTVVSAGGGTLSGGQRQRLMIAQALVRRPRILFFDEATSALDNETQRIVTESTRKLRATRVVIAHRLSTVMDADRVFVMDQGRIVQQGTPAELRSDTAGLFHQLVRRQL
jgi:ATP-binding cassette subfamily C protein